MYIYICLEVLSLMLYKFIFIHTKEEIWYIDCQNYNTKYYVQISITESLFPALGHQSIVAECHNIWKFTEKLFMARDCHSLLWPKVTIFENPQDYNRVTVLVSSEGSWVLLLLLLLPHRQFLLPLLLLLQLLQLMHDAILILKQFFSIFHF